MKGLLIILIILVWLGALYYGFVQVVGHTMKSGQSQYKVFHGWNEYNDQQRKIDDLKEQQKQMLEDREQFIRTQRDQMRMQ